MSESLADTVLLRANEHSTMSWRSYRFELAAWQDDALYDFAKLVARIVNRPETHEQVFPGGREA